MSRVTFLAILLSLLATTFLGCGKIESRVPPELNDKIVYVSEEGICTINPDGTDRKVIVPSEKGGPFSNPRWSPDKRRIAFNGLVDSHNRIMVVSSEGSNLEIFGFPKRKTKKSKPERMRIVMTEEYDLYFYGWSPSGEYFLYYQPVIDGDITGVMSTEGSVKIKFAGFSPCFVGEDSVVYSEAYVSGRAGMFGYDLNTKKRWNIAKDSNPKPHFPLVCSSNGKVAFGWEGEGRRDELWVTDFSGSESAKIASQNVDFSGGNLKVIMFSPKGDELLFIPNAGNKSEIYVIGTDGTGLRKVTENIVKANGGVSWSPDGKRIIFVSDQDGNDELYIASIDGTGLKRLTNNNIKDCYPDW